MVWNAASPTVTLQLGTSVVILLELCVAATYTDLWAVQVEGGEHAAKRIAEQHGFTYIGEIMPDYYSFHHRSVQKRSDMPGHVHSYGLGNDSQVKWLEQQTVKRRVKRDLQFNDPKWPSMWYLHGGGDSKEPSRLDMNVRQAWMKGYTGKGVVVTILDDGIERSHPDLERNYNPLASYDVNDRDYDPSPRYDYTNENRHGTRCAGEVAAVADNGVCGVGVAYRATVGGVRMLDGDVTDSVEAMALSYNRQYIDIYSASWGPDDDGKTVDGPASLARKAFRDGIAKGRDGKGSIFIWASGNGGRDLDNCNCDGYTNSIYTLSISSATESGHVPWYSEACSSTLATTYSSGGANERQVITTDLRRSCTDSHTGTSASAPLAAGICALALEANPVLTWRDMQHIVVMTSNPAGLHAAAGSSGWRRNGAGRNVSDNFGYGMMDAAAMVDLAVIWTTVPEQHVCEVESTRNNELIQPFGKLVIRLPVDGCAGDAARHVRYLEHVQVKISLTTSRRGDISMYLVSPAGTTSTLLARRQNDNNKAGFNEWAFMTTHSWGELAQGTWQLEVHNGCRTMKPARLSDWTLILYGTDRHPLGKDRGPLSHRSILDKAGGVKGAGAASVGGGRSESSQAWSVEQHSSSVNSDGNDVGKLSHSFDQIRDNGDMGSGESSHRASDAERVRDQDQNALPASLDVGKTQFSGLGTHWFDHGDDHRHEVPGWWLNGWAPLPTAEGAGGDWPQKGSANSAMNWNQVSALDKNSPRLHGKAGFNEGAPPLMQRIAASADSGATLRAWSIILYGTSDNPLQQQQSKDGGGVAAASRGKTHHLRSSAPTLHWSESLVAVCVLVGTGLQWLKSLLAQPRRKARSSLCTGTG